MRSSHKDCFLNPLGEWLLLAHFLPFFPPLKVFSPTRLPPNILTYLPFLFPGRYATILYQFPVNYPPFTLRIPSIALYCFTYFLPSPYSVIVPPDPGFQSYVHDPCTFFLLNNIFFTLYSTTNRFYFLFFVFLSCFVGNQASRKTFYIPIVLLLFFFFFAFPIS